MPSGDVEAQSVASSAGKVQTGLLVTQVAHICVRIMLNLLYLAQTYEIVKYFLETEAMPDLDALCHTLFLFLRSTQCKVMPE